MSRIPLAGLPLAGLPLAGLVLCGLFAFAAGPAWADDEPAEESRFFEEYDKNADGIVTEAEFGGSGEVFRLLDKDGDGKVSPTDLGLPADFRPDPNARKRRERAARGRNRGNKDRQQRLKQMLKRLDVNQDGAVTKAEWKGNANLFDRLDRNSDGKIDRVDYPALFPSMEMDGGMMDGPDGKTDKPGAPTTPGGPEPNKEPRKRGKKKDKPGRDISVEQVRKRFQQLDKDADQQLTAEDGVNERLIERMDADQSGGVSLAEFEAAVKKASGARQPGRAKGNPERIRKMLKRFDQDRDGKVSKDEFPGSEERFDRMDTNGDGFLSDADFGEPQKPADKPKQDDAPITPGDGDK